MTRPDWAKDKAKHPYEREIDRELGLGTELTIEDMLLIEYARTYTGRFPFMKQMHELARKSGWRPTPRQLEGMRRCWEHDQRRAALGTKPPRQRRRACRCGERTRRARRRWRGAGGASVARTGR